jgi:tRNA threonylcarbamoyladenosine biosynthesis protein TsaB
MPLILSLETSTPVCSVALHAGGQLLASLELYSDKSHSNALTRLVEQALAHGGYSMQALDAIAVAKGPGSYTGLRIGTATAKGLCYALDKPLIAVSTLEAMAQGMRNTFVPDNFLLCPMLDARRMEVYCAVYDQHVQEIRPVDAIIINEQSFSDLLAQHPVVFFGNGAAKSQAVLSYSPNAHFSVHFHPLARYVGELAQAKYTRQEFENVAYFEPFYLKEFFFKGSTKQL